MFQLTLYGAVRSVPIDVQVPAGGFVRGAPASAYWNSTLLTGAPEELGLAFSVTEPVR